MSQDPRALLQKAEKAVAGASGGFSLFGGRQEKWENAADLYTQAANAFRLQKQNKEAGEAFEKCAAIQTDKLNEADDAANTFTEAFKVYKKGYPEDAARCLNVAINHYTSRGNFRRAATHKQNVAEVFENELGDMKRAMESYELAANWFENDNAEALANKLYLKVADIAALEGDYYKAIENFEKVSTASLNNNLMKWSVKDYFLKSGLCHLAVGDLVATNRALEKYRDLDPSFTSTREHQLLIELSEAVDAGDQEIFADKLFQYDQISKLDKWKTTILLKIKNSIEEKGEDFS
ncbi:putative vesicular-fusion protein sec17 [Erysiphe necator]|uniref:Putative vesicular-fusion protein sec17 n=1 Tax=Uncinula necator TaxID=52586 RepID=A0A0B1P3H0_UNCNE|nr:putative vesicular-fusion protein sec17 [Erysiphe necator]KHJ32788.1 putative vesicular-fusion protein sec17 [Erysiphe necator]